MMNSGRQREMYSEEGKKRKEERERERDRVCAGKRLPPLDRPWGGAPSRMSRENLGKEEEREKRGREKE